MKKPDPPAVKNAVWVKTPIDAFVLAHLEARGVTPSPLVDRRTLIRRVTLDLHGLPPTPEEVAAFETDRSPDAYVRLVDRSAGVAALRRTLGPALARRGPLRRLQGLRLQGGTALSLRLHLPRLRHPRVQRRPALRPIRRAATRRRSAAAGRGQTAVGGARVSSRWAGAFSTIRPTSSTIAST